MAYSINNSSPLVSVCLPIFNARDFLPKAIECISKQIYKNFEVIIVDDGSQDSSGALASELLNKYDLNGKVVTSINKGCEQARDLCCEHANGEMFAPFDADDVWFDDYLHKMVGVLIDNPDMDLVYSDFNEVFEDTGVRITKSSRTPWVDLTKAEARQAGVFCFPKNQFFEILLQGQVIFPPCSVFRKEIYNTVGGYSKRLPELRISLDWWFALVVSSIGSIAYQSEPLLLKRRHSSNVSGNAIKTSASDVIVIEALLHDGLIPESLKHIAHYRASIRAIDSAYGLFEDERNGKEARKWLMKSLLHKFSLRSVKLYMATLLPQWIINSIRKSRNLYS